MCRLRGSRCAYLPLTRHSFCGANAALARYDLQSQIACSAESHRLLFSAFPIPIVTVTCNPRSPYRSVISFLKSGYPKTDTHRRGERLAHQHELDSALFVCRVVQPYKRLCGKVRLWPSGLPRHLTEAAGSRQGRALAERSNHSTSPLDTGRNT